MTCQLQSLLFIEMFFKFIEKLNKIEDNVLGEQNLHLFEA